jgi:glyoxylase-like metal-dependent hydrolase (beta-lactamase superfamily II)
MLLGLALLLGSPATASPDNQRLDDHTILVPGGIEPGRQPDGNSVLIEGPDGMVVVDTGRHAAHSDAILAAAGAKPIVAIVNSHWHLDHTSGNPRIKAKFPNATVYASNAIDGALSGFLQDSAKQGRDALASGQLPATIAEDVRGDLATLGDGQKLRPDVVIAQSQAMKLGGRTLAVNLSPNAATAGDVWIFDAGAKRVIAGDLVTLPVPFLDTACPQGWKNALARIAGLSFTSLIPGHGPVMSRADFDAYRLAFDGFVDCADSGQPMIVCTGGWNQAARRWLGDEEAKTFADYAGYYGDLIRSGKLSKYCPA